MVRYSSDFYGLYARENVCKLILDDLRYSNIIKRQLYNYKTGSAVELGIRCRVSYYGAGSTQYWLTNNERKRVIRMINGLDQEK